MTPIAEDWKQAIRDVEMQFLHSRAEDDAYLNDVEDRAREIAAARQASEPAGGELSSEGDWTVVDCPHCHKCVTYSKKDVSSKIAYRDLCAEIEQLKADRDRLAAELAEAKRDENIWREGWAFAYSGSNLYGDDGELQDNRFPMIDWRRDTAQDIKRKIYERGMSALIDAAARNKP